MKTLIIALASFALLGGCIKVDKSPPKDLPPYVRLYPGASPMMHMNVGPMASEVLQSTDKPDDVIAYYRSQASSDGLQEGAAPAPAGASSDQRQATFSDQATGRMLVIVAKPQANGTIVSLTYKPAAQAPS